MRVYVRVCVNELIIAVRVVCAVGPQSGAVAVVSDGDELHILHIQSK